MTDTPIVNEAHQRHASLFNANEYSNKKIVIVGAGTIGSWTALCLAKMGISNIHLYDNDTVEVHNIGTQLFGALDVGNSKVSSVYHIVSDLTGACIVEHNEKLTTPPIDTDILILAVDSLQARKELLAGWIGHVIDGRMGGEGFEVHYATKGDNIVVPSEASEDLCTAKGIAYVSMGIAAEIANITKRILKGQDVPNKVMYREYSTQQCLGIKAPQEVAE
jgi:hypothetical protein